MAGGATRLTELPRIPISPDTLRDMRQGIVTNMYAGFNPGIRQAISAVTGPALAVRALDPITAELVRLRNAELQGCHY